MIYTRNGKSAARGAVSEYAGTIGAGICQTQIYVRYGNVQSQKSRTDAQVHKRSVWDASLASFTSPGCARALKYHATGCATEVGVLKNEMCTRATWHGKGTGVRANL